VVDAKWGDGAEKEVVVGEESPSRAVVSDVSG